MKPKGKRLYLAGPMTNKPSFGIPEFDVAARVLREEGHDAVSPAELDDPTFRRLCLTCKTGDMAELHRRCKETGTPVETWGDLLARDLKLIANDGIEAIVVLPGWDKSRGATLETYVGRLCGLPILRYPDLKPVAKVELERVHGQATKPFDNRFWPPSEMERMHTEGMFGARSRFVTREGEIRRVDGKTGGEKGEKPERMDLLPWSQLEEVARLYAYGAKKYASHNWRKGYDWSLAYASMIRHAAAFWEGEEEDADSKCSHLASVAFHALSLMYFAKHHREKDDRP